MISASNQKEEAKCQNQLFISSPMKMHFFLIQKLGISSKNVNGFFKILSKKKITFNLKKANSTKIPLSTFEDAYIPDAYFKEVRKILSPYTTRLKKLFIQFQEFPDTLELSSNTFAKLQEIHKDAYSWYETFNKTVTEYRMKKDIYLILFNSTLVQIY